MSKPNWACSKCGMYSSRRWSVERHIQNLHQGIGSVIPFVAYLAGIQSGFYVPKFRPTFAKSAVKAVTVMDTFKEELLKGFASKAADKVLNSSSAAVQINQQQGFGSIGAPYINLNQFYSGPSSIIPRPEDIFGFKILICKKCSSINTIIMCFIDGKEGGSRIGWSPCCDFATFNDLKVDQNRSNMQLQKIQDKLKYCVQTWTNNKSILTAIRIPESFLGNSVRLLQGGTHKSISLEYYSEKHIEIDIDDENHWAPKSVRAGTTALSYEDLSDFLSKTENSTFGFFTVKIKECKRIYLMAILNDIVVITMVS